MLSPKRMPGEYRSRILLSFTNSTALFRGDGLRQTNSSVGFDFSFRRPIMYNPKET